MFIILNAFSFLRKQLSEKGFAYLNAPMQLPDGISANGLIEHMGLEQKSIEAVFINHLVKPKETVLHNGDRVAFVPPGTPGSYRLMLGMKKVGED